MEEKGIHIGAHIKYIGGIDDNSFDPLKPALEHIRSDFPVLDEICGQQMRDEIEQARKNGDSVGGSVECAVTGMPAGYGGPLFDGVEGKIAAALYGIPAVKGLWFGDGISAPSAKGSRMGSP